MTALAIKKQVEFYFSDSNFRKDVFLKTAADSDPEGFVPISVLLTFNKLKSLSTNSDEIANALADSKVVIVSDDKLKIRRSNPLPEADTSKACTLYVKGFPLNDVDVTIESVAREFSSYGSIQLVRLRRDPHNKVFKGSAFIEFEDPAAVEAVCKAAYGDDSTTVKLSYKDVPYLCVLSLTDWLAKKKAKRQRQKDEKAKPDTDKKRKRENDGSDDKLKAEVPAFTPGLIVKISSLPSDATFTSIKDAFKTISEVKYVDFNKGDSNAFLRFPDVDAVKNVLQVVSDGFKISESDEKLLTATSVDGDEEITFWKSLESKKHDKKPFVSRGRGKKNFGSKRGRR